MSSLKEKLKKYEELKKMCDDYDGSNEQFPEIVLAYIELDESHKITMASNLQLARSTIGRWARGQVFPLSRMQKEVVRYISRRAKRQVRILENAVAIQEERKGD